MSAAKNANTKATECVALGFYFCIRELLSFLVAYQLSYICLPLRVIDSQLKYFLSIIHDSFLFIALIALQFARKFLLFVAVIEEFVCTFIIIIDIIIRQINRVTFVLRNLQLTGRLCSQETSMLEVT